MPHRMSRSQGSHSSQAQPIARKRTSVQEAHVPQLLTIDQVAERLQVHRTTVYDFINLTGLKVIRLAAHAVRVDEADLKAWIEQRKAES